VIKILFFLRSLSDTYIFAFEMNYHNLPQDAIKPYLFSMQEKSILLSLIAIFFGVSACTNFGATDNISIMQNDMHNRIKGGISGQLTGQLVGDAVCRSSEYSSFRGFLQAASTDSLFDKAFGKSGSQPKSFMVQVDFLESIEKMGIQVFFDSLFYEECRLYQSMADWNPANPITSDTSNQDSGELCDKLYILGGLAGIINPGMPDGVVRLMQLPDSCQIDMEYYYSSVFLGFLYSGSLIHSNLQDNIRISIKMLPDTTITRKLLSYTYETFLHQPSEGMERIRNKALELETEMKVTGTNLRYPLEMSILVYSLLSGEGKMLDCMKAVTDWGHCYSGVMREVCGVCGITANYDEIPLIWRQQLTRVQEIPVTASGLTAGHAFGLCFKHTVLNIIRNDGNIDTEHIEIPIKKMEDIDGAFHPDLRRN